MLELRSYKKAELAAIVGTNDRQGIERKLQRNKVVYETSGRGENLVFEIIAIHDPFKIYALWELKIDPHADFIKIRNLYYYFFCCDGFAELPVFKQAELLQEDNRYVSEQTITKWIEYLGKLQWIFINPREFTYHAIYKDNQGKKVMKDIERKLYAEGWKTYWTLKEEYAKNGEEHPGSLAYRKMVKLIGGHPFKKPLIEHNVFYAKDVEYMVGLITESFLNEEVQQKF